MNIGHVSFQVSALRERLETHAAFEGLLMSVRPEVVKEFEEVMINLPARLPIDLPEPAFY